MCVYVCVCVCTNIVQMINSYQNGYNIMLRDMH